MIVHPCIRKQCRIQRVIWVVVRKHNVGDIARINTKSLKWPKYLSAVIHHARVNDYRGGSVSYEADGGLDASRRGIDRPNDKHINYCRQCLGRVVAPGFHLDVHQLVEPPKIALVLMFDARDKVL
jgi:hypothetical protein